jgi:hypothetical protein
MPDPQHVAVDVIHGLEADQGRQLGG